MALNYNRMFSLPNSIKFFTLVLSLLVLLCVGSAHVQPGGTGFIWASAVLSLIVDLLLVLLLMLELDQVVFPRGAFFSWPLLECTTSILFGITYFISIWLCANGSSKGSYAAFLFAGLFSLLNFSAYAFNVVIFGRIWANEYRVEVGGSRLTEDPEPPSYGGP